MRIGNFEELSNLERCSAKWEKAGKGLDNFRGGPSRGQVSKRRAISDVRVFSAEGTKLLPATNFKHRNLRIQTGMLPDRLRRRRKWRSMKDSHREYGRGMGNGKFAALEKFQLTHYNGSSFWETPQHVQELTTAPKVLIVAGCWILSPEDGLLWNWVTSNIYGSPPYEHRECFSLT